MSKAAVTVMSIYDFHYLPKNSDITTVAANLLSYLTEVTFTLDRDKSYSVLLEDTDLCIVINAIANRFYGIFDDEDNGLNDTRYNFEIILKYATVELINEVRRLLK